MSEKKITEELFANGEPMEMSDDMLIDVTGGRGKAPQVDNLYKVKLAGAKSYLPLLSYPEPRKELEIGPMPNNSYFQSYNTFSPDGKYVYGFSFFIDMEGWAEKDYLKRKK